jgi:hypothetical protein
MTQATRATRYTFRATPQRKVRAAKEEARKTQATQWQHDTERDEPATEDLASTTRAANQTPMT